MRKLLLGIDIGTSACKVAVFDEEGRVLAQANRDYPVYYPKSGWAEQDPEEWWDAICRGIRSVLEAEEVSAEEICGIGVDGQSWSAIPVDREGRVLDRTPIWMDTRAREICGRIKKESFADELFEAAGNEFLPSYSTPKMLWFKQERPDIFQKTYRFLQSNSYIAYRLTDQMSQDYSQGYGIHFFDMNRLTYREELANKLGLTQELVPPLSGCDEIIGEVTEEAAKITDRKSVV